MTRKRKRGTTSSGAKSGGSEAIPSAEIDRAATAPTETTTTPVAGATTTPTRRERRTTKRDAQQKDRRDVSSKSKGVRPWILPGFAGIAIIAIVLIGVSALSSDNGGSTGADVPSPVLGEQTAKVVIHEYGDFQCPFCGVFARTIKPQLQERFIDRGVVQLVWHDFAWYGQESRDAANAARCAGDQGQFWPMHDLLYQRQSGENLGAFSRDNLKRFGDDLGLEPEAFRSCVDGNDYAAAIDADMSRVRRLGLNGTPSFTIGDQRIVGAQPFEIFEQAVLRELQKQG